MKKKTRNVAVVAAARKLAAIGWQMLVTGEPYRYAIPRSTETKLSRLRVKATGQRRKSGPAKGSKGAAKLPAGSRTIRSLPEVCQSEGLPEPRPLSPGEQRTVKQSDGEVFVAQIAAAHVVPRRTAASPTSHAGQHAATPQDASRKRTSTVSCQRPPSAPTLAPLGQASCQSPAPVVRSVLRFRPPRAGEQGDEAPPPAPPTLFSLPGEKSTAARKKSTPAS
jgi:transposase